MAGRDSSAGDADRDTGDHAEEAARRALPSRMQSILGSILTGTFGNCSEPFMRGALIGPGQ
jgi:hypothetical protein